MIEEANFEKSLLGFDNVEMDADLGKDIKAFRFIDDENGESTMFALIYTGSKPLKISLRCDSQLSKSLREEYETVMPGENLDRKIWNTIICSGQLAESEIMDLARLAYNIVSGLA